MKPFVEKFYMKKICFVVSRNSVTLINTAPSNFYLSWKIFPSFHWGTVGSFSCCYLKMSLYSQNKGIITAYGSSYCYDILYVSFSKALEILAKTLMYPWFIMFEGSLFLKSGVIKANFWFW